MDGFALALVHLVALEARRRRKAEPPEDPAARVARIDETLMTISVEAARLYRRYEATGKSFPSRNRVAKQLGVKAKVVRSWQQELVDAGLISRQAAGL